MSRVLLVLLIEHLAQGDEPLVFGIDETLERRRGSRISARGVFRDAVRSSESHLVKASGLRWVSLMWLTHIPWANRTWALPVLTALAPAESYHQKVGRPHKKITDWARQMIIQLRRWLPDRRIVVVTDMGYAALELLHSCQSLRQPVTFISRLRLDAALFEPAPPRLPGQIGRPRLKGRRLPSPIALLDNPRCVLESPIGALEGRTGTHTGVYIRDRSLVSLGKTSRAYQVGADQRPALPDENAGAGLHRY